MYSSKQDLFSTGQHVHRKGVYRRLALVVVSVLTLSLCVTLTLSSRGTTPKAHAASWNEVWNDEFNGAANTAVDSQWQFDLGTGWGNNQVETDTNSTSNIYQDGNGHLAIKAINNNGSWTSGRIETTNSSFAAPAGGELEVTASIQLPNVTGSAAQGYWPAFWMLGAGIRNGGVWPSIGEIDAMESVNGTNVEYGTLHCGVNPGGPCNETYGLGGNTPCSGTTCQGGFHTYTVIVDRSTSPEEIRWYLDGTEFWHVASNNPGMDATTWANAVDHSFFIILNVAIGGGWPGNPTSSTQSGAHMDVDYVRVYTANGSTGGSGAPIGQTIWLKAYNGLYASARIDQTNSPLNASASQVQAWEEYRVVDAGNGLIALQAVANGEYVSARLDQGNTPLDASATQVQAWEEFTWLPQGNGTVALRANANGDYVSARLDQTNTPLDASVTQIQAWEIFQWGTV